MTDMGSFQFITLLGLGFALGLKHALDADHVVAVSTIVSQTRSLKKSSLFGALWGAGHTTTLFLAGLVILIFKLAIPDKLALSFEFLVGMVLVILGVDVLRKIIRDKVHLHRHKHDRLIHAHFHSHKGSPLHSHSHRSFIVGMIHGLAGSAALMLLVLATVKSIFHGLLYILIFGIGSILGMLITSAIIGLPFVLTARFDRINNSVTILAGTISIVLGLIIMYEIGVVNGLFF
jgi:high-affinity nickel permease